MGLNIKNSWVEIETTEIGEVSDNYSFDSNLKNKTQKMMNESQIRVCKTYP